MAIAKLHTCQANGLLCNMAKQHIAFGMGQRKLQINQPRAKDCPVARLQLHVKHKYLLYPQPLISIDSRKNIKLLEVAWLSAALGPDSNIDVSFRIPDRLGSQGVCHPVCVERGYNAYLKFSKNQFEQLSLSCVFVTSNGKQSDRRISLRKSDR